MYTWDDIIDLEPLWKKTFDGDSLPKGAVRNPYAEEITVAQMAQILGGTLGSYIILHLILLAYRETKHRVRSILQAGALSLVATEIGLEMRLHRPSDHMAAPRIDDD